MGNTAKVVGVLHYNDATRDELLKRLNWRRDYLENFTPDTKLERIANEIFTQELAIATYANNDRDLARKYITPELVNFYGSSPGLNTKLAKYTFGQDYTGRISDIDEANVKFEHEYLSYLLKDNVEGIELLANEDMAAPRRHMLNMLIDAGRLKGDSMYYLSQANRYVEFRQALETLGDIQGTITNEDEFNDGNKYVSTNNSRSETQFDESDIAGLEGIGVSTTNDSFLSFYNVPQKKPKSLLSKTNDLFNRHKINTLAARFHTSSEISTEIETTDTAKSQFGNSHGRNLLKKNPYDNSLTNGYENPYCRVWTYHHQYDRMSRLIRPFTEADSDGNVVATDAVYDMDPYKAEYKSASNGRDYLKANTVLGKNGRVTIAPKGDCGKINTEIKKCMFSIENLAWKDVPRNMGYISKEQRGPNGGRIMWFPPYDLDFSESVQVDWNQNKFIGRGEPVFTYSNTTRQGQLSFALLIDHPSIIDNIPKYNIKHGDTTEDGAYVEDEDVLRFFAGCQVPSLKKQIECPDDGPDSDQQGNGDEPSESIPTKEKSVHVKFYVYYPNNYSGNSVKISRDQWAQSGSSDRSWFEYILYGQNTILDHTENGCGYETSPRGIPISSGGDDSQSMPVYADCKDWEDGKGELKEDESGYKIFYKYRVDFDLHQKLFNRLPGQKLFTRSGCTATTISNYYDSKDFQLNSAKTNLPKDATHTFQEIVRIMFCANQDLFAPLKNITSDSNAHNVDPEDSLVKAFKGKKITKVHIKAGATKQDSEHTDVLAMRRARAVKDLLTTFGNVSEDVFDDYEPVPSADLKDKTDINSLEAKLQRFASVDLWYDDPEIVKLSETTHTTEGTVTGEEATGWHLIENNENEVHYGDDIEAAVHIESMPVASSKVKEPEIARYETEAEYFKNIELTAPFVYKSIIEKFKYFNPAFHSMSPEGFNARLTFLQQCTRQGHTISATDLSYAKTAGNLAFGRMPVCVLRIGDFINTKIIINSMSITYGANGNPQWDLNPEGIGVQPMYAKVQLGIVIIGGQSLEGPINRLQNAVSFNYYANTGVYDNRSDRIGMATEKRVFSGDGEYVREETVETSGDKLKVWDESEYEYTKTVYNNIWTPYPNLRVKDDYNNDIASYNEYKAKGGSSGVEKDENGRYRLKQ